MTILVDCPLSSFCRTEKSVVPSAAGTTISPSMIAEAALMCQASCETFLNRWVQGPLLDQTALTSTEWRERDTRIVAELNMVGTAHHPRRSTSGRMAVDCRADRTLHPREGDGFCQVDDVRRIHLDRPNNYVGLYSKAKSASNRN
jgi:hypothetical protein